jgi:hypothetical protein
MAKLLESAAKFFRGAVSRKSKVLLINPPVQERRYHWIRWNQPTELLKLSTWLKGEFAGIDVRLFDFMMPDEAGAVLKHKVKETWASEDGDQLWHFGTPFEKFDDDVTRLSQEETWTPDVIVISSLTSYWHSAIEKLLIKLCNRLGRKRQRVKVVLYGNYPRFEPEHAASQADADIALATTVSTAGCCPDWALYARLPNFFALDIEDPLLGEHLRECLRLQTARLKKIRNARPPTVNVAFFNDDVCSEKSRLDAVIQFREKYPKALFVDGIAGIRPESLTRERLIEMKRAGFRSLFVEHARTAGGGIDEAAYEPLQRVLREEEHNKKTGASGVAWLEGAVTAFVAIGLADDDMEMIVGATLRLNSLFHSIIMKPFGYSPTIDRATTAERRARWRRPSFGSPQFFPYVGHGSSSLLRTDYANLLAWQNVLNKRVKGTTFDFLDGGNVAKLVRETLIAESWRPHAEGA